MTPERLSGRPRGGHTPHERAPAEVFRRFFDLIDKLERNRRITHPPAPEMKARISRLDEPNRRLG